jgi:hypothetical protein
VVALGVGLGLIGEAVGDALGGGVGLGVVAPPPHVTASADVATCALVPGAVPSSTCATYRLVTAVAELTLTVAVVPAPCLFIWTRLPLVTS